METVIEFIFLGSKISADGDCSHEIRRHLLLGRKAITNLDSILKSRGIILPTKVHIVKAMIFPVVIYGCKSWIIKKVEHWRIDAFELWCWRRLFRVLGQQGDQTNPSERKTTLNIHWKNWCWSSPDVKSQLIAKDPDTGKDWRQKEKRATEDEMVR